MTALVDKASGRRASNRAWWKMMLGVSLVIALAATASIRHQTVQQREQAMARLEAMANLHATQLQGWLQRQMQLAWYLDDSPVFAEMFNRWQDQGDSAAGARLLERATEFRKAAGADAVLLIDAQGRRLASERPPSTPAPNEVLGDAMREAIARGQAVHTTIYERPGSRMPLRLDIVIPLLKTGETPRGAIVLCIDPQRALFPLLESLATRFDGTESVMWRQQGDRVVNVSSTRIDPHAPGSISEPLATSAMIIARTMRREVTPGDAVMGADYRGAPVIGAALPIDGTPWWVVTKQSLAAIDIPARDSMRWTVAVAGMGLLSLALVSRMLMQRRWLATDRRERAEQRERLRTLALLQSIAQSASDSIFAKDVDGRYVFYNRAAEEAFGLRADEVIGHTNSDLFASATAEHLTRHDREVMLSKTPTVFEETLNTPRGTITVLCTKGPLLDDEGRVIGMLGVSRDVTEARRAERALRDSEAHHRSVISSLSEGILVCDAEGRVLSCNPAAERITGVSERRWKGGSTIAPGWTPRRADNSPMPAEETPAGRVLAGGPAQHDVLLTATSPYGASTIFELSAVPVFSPDSGQLMAVVTSFADVSERTRSRLELERHRHRLEDLVAERTRALEAANEALSRSRDLAEAATRAKSAFLANMSHEIRTPMNAIIGMAHMMKRDTVDALQQSRLGKIDDAAQHLLKVINDVLDLSKIEAGKLRLDHQDFSVDRLLTNSFAMVNESAEEKGLELVLDTDHLPRRLRGDPTRLSQMLINLLSNAVKFTDRGWVRLRVRALQREGERLLLRFEVQDTGSGIAPERQGALFTAFEQADGSSTRRHGGTGLGLALTRQLALAMGGETGLHSNPPDGSIFWFTAWLEQSGDEPQRPATLAAGSLRALLVDDLPEALIVLGDGLKMLGLAVDAVASSSAALQRVAEEVEAGRHYDVMLIDWRMEGLDGIQTLQQLRALGGDIPPSILVTAADDPGLRTQAQDAGFAAVLQKPITASALYACIAAVMGMPGAVLPSPHLEPSEPELLLRGHHAGQRVLLAEDNLINLEVAEDLLRSAGLVVETALDGEQAIEMALARPFDLILMDMQMPVLDGLEATRQLRRQLPYPVPVIAMTANAFSDDRALCLAAGMNDHVAKPVNPVLLYRTLQRWLPRRPAGSAADAPAQTATAPAVAAEAPAAPDELIERLRGLEGFDVGIALRNVGGQASFLAHVLLDFVDVYQAGEPRLAMTGSPDDAQRWRQACHSLLGAASTIGATQLAEAAARLEQELKAGASTPLAAASAREVQQRLIDFVRRLSAELEAADARHAN